MFDWLRKRKGPFSEMACSPDCPIHDVSLGEDVTHLVVRTRRIAPPHPAEARLYDSAYSERAQ